MTYLLLALSLLMASTATFEEPPVTNEVKVALVKMPYKGARNVPELSTAPDYLEQGGLRQKILDLGCQLASTRTVKLSASEQKQYGEWHRVGLANGHLGKIVADNHRSGYFSVGLLANCSSLMGMLAGVQHSGETSEPLRVGLVFVDSHGDFNTPETTLSGMLGGMPVAISAGLCLKNLRLKSGLDSALTPGQIVMAAVRDTDTLEQELIDRHRIAMISVDDIRQKSANVRLQMERLSKITDRIYIHIDMDVLDPGEVSGHPLTVANGPSSAELAQALTEMFRFPKASALGIASTPAWENDPEGLALTAAYTLIEGTLRGVQSR